MDGQGEGCAIGVIAYAGVYLTSIQHSAARSTRFQAVEREIMGACVFFGESYLVVHRLFVRARIIDGCVFDQAAKVLSKSIEIQQPEA